MYKAIVIVVIAIVGIATASNGLNVQSHNIRRVKSTVGFPKVSIDVCPECIDVADESIQILLNLILDTGILGSCQTLCEALAQKTGSQIAGVICDFACSAFGIVEFIKLLDKADIDPIWYCEIAKMCPVNDHGDAKITQFSITPPTGKKGTTFTIDFTYVSVNGTGTGEIDIDIDCPDKMPVGSSFLSQAKKPGTYTEKITVKAEPDPRCDPTQEPCEEWLPGTYNVTVQVCNGECGSKHPHSTIYSTSKGVFTLTK